MSLTRKQKNSRIHSKKALTAISAIQEKFSSGIADVAAISEESRAWLQMKIQQFRECIKEVKFPSKPVWWETMRLARNKTAHQKEDFTEAEFSNFCGNLFTSIEKIVNDLKSNIKRYRHHSKKKRKFENFASSAFGTEIDRKQLVDAMENKISPESPEDVKIEFPQNTFAKVAEETLSEILRHENVHPYMLGHEGLSENIQTDILEWLTKTQAALEKENPFFDETMFISQQKKRAAEEIALDLSAENSKIQYHYKRLPSVSESKRGSIAPSTVDFDFYHKKFLEQKKTSVVGSDSDSFKSPGETSEDGHFDKLSQCTTSKAGGLRM